MASKQARAKEFSPKVREVIKRRDGGCIFCRMNYQMEKINWFDSQLMSIMHYISRSKGGLGIEQNGALGCQYHHSMLDNGNQDQPERCSRICVQQDHGSTEGSEGARSPGGIQGSEEPNAGV